MLGSRNDAVFRALEEFAIFQPCDDYNKELVDLLLDTRSQLRKGRDEGEAEAVIQASKLDVAIVLTDDALGREWAEQHTRNPHGTLWILDRLRTNGFITELRPLFLKSITDKRRQPIDLMNQILDRHSEKLIEFV